MDAQEYFELGNIAHGEWELPEEFFDEYKEFDSELMQAVLIEKRLVVFDLMGRMVLTNKLKETMPEVHILMTNILGGQEQSIIDDMVDQEELTFHVDERGKQYYIDPGDDSEVVNVYWYNG